MEKYADAFIAKRGERKVANRGSWWIVFRPWRLEPLRCANEGGKLGERNAMSSAALTVDGQEDDGMKVRGLPGQTWSLAAVCPTSAAINSRGRLLPLGGARCATIFVPPYSYSLSL